MLCESVRDIQKNLNICMKALDRFNMKVHLQKTKLMRVVKQNQLLNIRIKGTNIERVDQKIITWEINLINVLLQFLLSIFYYLSLIIEEVMNRYKQTRNTKKNKNCSI